MEINYMQIGDRIKQHRKFNKLSQQILSDKCNIEPSYISHIERGTSKLSLQTLVKIANALNITADELLCDNIKSSTPIFTSEIADIIADLSNTEIRIICDTIKELKKTLRKNL